MRHSRAGTWVWVGTALLLAVAPLGAEERKAARKPKGPVGTVIESSAVSARVEKLSRDLEWVGALDAAKKRAAREGKMILWLHALGDLDGLT